MRSSTTGFIRKLEILFPFSIYFFYTLMLKLNPLDHPICLETPSRLTPASAWHEHIPFAMFLVDVSRPKIIVELGTQSGDSYCAFCQAVKELYLDTLCYAIDTWQGDPHAGLYGPEVLADLRSHHDPLYGSFSCLIQSTFDEALSHFADGTVDLLHIDGYHTYESVKHDFESWLPKMSPSGLVLLHDTNVREHDFGIRKFWDEIKSKYPHFEFLHDHGLGILAIGKIRSTELKQLFHLSEEDSNTVREFFFHLGQRLTTKVRTEVRDAELNNTLHAKDAQIAELTNGLQTKDNQIAELNTALHAKDNQIAELSAALQAKDNQIAELNTNLQAKDAQLAQLSSTLQAKDAWLQQIQHGIVMQLVNRYQRVVEKLLRPGTRRRGIYELGLRGIRSILNEGWKGFWFQFKLWRGQRKIKPLQQTLKLPKFNPSLSKKDVRKIRFPQSSPNPEVSIIIPVYNNLVYTLNCLKSISQNTEGDYEVIVVDDASKDGTYRALSKIENLHLLKNKHNAGFIDSCNRGTKESRGKYILFLNNDTMVTKGWLPPLLDIIKRDDVGAVGSKLTYPDGTLQEAGSIVWNDGSALGYGRGDNAEKPEYNYVRDVDYCSGAALMVKRELFEKIGLFDERFKPGYYEDTDLCFSIRNLGYRVMYQPMSLVTHYEGTTCGTDIHAGIKKYQEINKPKFVEKWRTILDKHDPYNSCKNILSSRNRHGGKNILILDDRIPTPDQGSGYPRAYRLLKFVEELGYTVTFFPLENMTPWQPYTRELQQLGIEVFYGNNLNLSQFAKDRTDCYDLVFVSRPHNMEKAFAIIRRSFPSAALLYDAEAIFSIREMLKARVRRDERTEKVAEEMIIKELNLVKKADLIITVSENERKIIAEKTGLNNVTVWGHPIEVKEPHAPFDERRDILFVGGFLGLDSPNEDAIIYFAKEVFPKIETELSCRLFIVGMNPPDSVKKLSTSSIIVTGYVEDLREYYERCRIFVVPHRYSAGIPWKLHEAMSHGIPCVVSKLTAAQLDLTDGKEVLVADTSEQFAEKVIKLYQDEKIWYAIQNHALNFVRQTCDPETMKSSLAQILTRGLKQISGAPQGELNMVSREKMQELLPFTAHRIEITKGIWTITDGGEDPRFALSTKALLKQACGGLSGKRVLDLGCLEGGYTAAFASMGASEAVGIEARQLNFERCLLVKRCLNLDNLTFYREDVKNATRDRFGEFDIVFASGILYHLDDPFAFLKNVYNLTLDFVLLDTHVAHKDFWGHSCSKQLIQRSFGGNTYVGRVAIEYAEEKEHSGEVENFLWSAYSNPTSFWLTEESLVQMLRDIGFEHIAKVYTPRGYRCNEGCQYECRIILIAKK